MLGEQIFRKMHDYNAWATGRILDTAAALDAGQFSAPTGANHGTLQALLIHTLRTEWIWRTLSTDGQIEGHPPFKLEPVFD
jgi:uncharacterized damage-inducible protein DinB